MFGVGVGYSFGGWRIVEVVGGLKGFMLVVEDCRVFLNCRYKM